MRHGAVSSQQSSRKHSPAGFGSERRARLRGRAGPGWPPARGTYTAQGSRKAARARPRPLRTVPPRRGRGTRRRRGLTAPPRSAPFPPPPPPPTPARAAQRPPSRSKGQEGCTRRAALRAAPRGPPPHLLLEVHLVRRGPFLRRASERARECTARLRLRPPRPAARVCARAPSRASAAARGRRRTGAFDRNGRTDQTGRGAALPSRKGTPFFGGGLVRRPASACGTPTPWEHLPTKPPCALLSAALQIG